MTKLTSLSACSRTSGWTNLKPSLASLDPSRWRCLLYRSSCGWKKSESNPYIIHSRDCFVKCSTKLYAHTKQNKHHLTSTKDLIPETVVESQDDISHYQRAEAFSALDVMCPSLRGRHQISTGANGNTLPLRIIKQMYGHTQWRSHVKPVNIKLSAYSGTRIPCLGFIIITCRYNGSPLVK